MSLKKKLFLLIQRNGSFRNLVVVSIVLFLSTLIIPSIAFISATNESTDIYSNPIHYAFSVKNQFNSEFNFVQFETSMGLSQVEKDYGLDDLTFLNIPVDWMPNSSSILSNYSIRPSNEKYELIGVSVDDLEDLDLFLNYTTEVDTNLTSLHDNTLKILFSSEDFPTNFTNLSLNSTIINAMTVENNLSLQTIGTYGQLNDEISDFIKLEKNVNIENISLFVFLYSDNQNFVNKTLRNVYVNDMQDTTQSALYTSNFKISYLLKYNYDDFQFSNIDQIIRSSTLINIRLTEYNNPNNPLIEKSEYRTTILEVANFLNEIQFISVALTILIILENFPILLIFKNLQWQFCGDLNSISKKLYQLGLYRIPTSEVQLRETRFPKSAANSYKQSYKDFIEEVNETEAAEESKEPKSIFILSMIRIYLLSLFLIIAFSVFLLITFLSLNRGDFRIENYLLHFFPSTVFLLSIILLIEIYTYFSFHDNLQKSFSQSLTNKIFSSEKIEITSEDKRNQTRIKGTVLYSSLILIPNLILLLLSNNVLEYYNSDILSIFLDWSFFISLTISLTGIVLFISHSELINRKIKQATMWILSRIRKKTKPLRKLIRTNYTNFQMSKLYSLILLIPILLTSVNLFCLDTESREIERYSEFYIGNNCRIEFQNNVNETAIKNLLAGYDIEYQFQYEFKINWVYSTEAPIEVTALNFSQYNEMNNNLENPMLINDRIYVNQNLDAIVSIFREHKDSLIFYSTSNPEFFDIRDYEKDYITNLNNLITPLRAIESPEMVIDIEYFNLHFSDGQKNTVVVIKDGILNDMVKSTLRTDICDLIGDSCEIKTKETTISLIQEDLSEFVWNRLLKVLSNFRGLYIIVYCILFIIGNKFGIHNYGPIQKSIDILDKNGLSRNKTKKLIFTVNTIDLIFKTTLIFIGLAISVIILNGTIMAPTYLYKFRLIPHTVNLTILSIGVITSIILVSTITSLLIFYKIRSRARSSID